MNDTNMPDVEVEATAAHTLTQIPVHVQRQFAKWQAQEQSKKTTIRLPIKKQYHLRKK